MCSDIDLSECSEGMNMRLLTQVASMFASTRIPNQWAKITSAALQRASLSSAPVVRLGTTCAIHVVSIVVATVHLVVAVAKKADVMR